MSGVKVDVQINYPSIIAGKLRISSFTAVASATAQLANPGSVAAPLIVCGGGSTYGGAAAKISDTPALYPQDPLRWPVTTWPTYSVSKNNVTLEQILDSSNIVIPTTIGHVFYLKGPLVGQVSQNGLTNGCGDPSNTWDGGAQPQPVDLPGDLYGAKGNSVPAIGAQVEAPGGCPAGTNISNWSAGQPGCIMFLPISNGYVPTSSNDPLMHIPGEAAFYVWCNKSSNGGGGCQEWVGQLAGGIDFTGNLLSNVTVGNSSGVPVAVHLTQ
jgi:hypothetical protein